MKLTQIFGIVVLIHVGVISLLLVQPGCQSTSMAEPDPAATIGHTGPTGQPTVTGAGTTTRSGQLDPAFNAGFTQNQSTAQTGRAEPMRPTEPTRPTPAVQPTADPALPVLQPVRPTTQPAAATAATTYTVQAGDNLTTIARRHGISIAELRAANNLTNDRINVGQQLLIPVEQSAATTTAAATAPQATAQPAPSATASRTVTVRAGDTLSRIAQREGTTVAALRTANRLSSDTIRVGQELVIPGTAATPAPAPTPTNAAPATTGNVPANAATYVVQPGDSPTTIARQLGVDVNELMRANNISDPRRLRVGQTLVVPGRTQQPAAATATTAAAGTPRTQAPTPMVPQASRPATLPSNNQQPNPLDLLEDEDNLPVVDFVEVDD